MNYEELLNNFDILNEQIAIAKKQMKDTSKGLVEEAVNRFLNTCPEVTGVHWVQYTPYFNDGDSCEFGVCDICFHILEDEDDEIDDFYDSTTLYTSADLNRALEDLKEAQEYTENPEAWRAKYLDNYFKKNGREYGYNSERLKPYPSDPTDAQERIDRIKDSLDKYPADVADRIKTNFKALTDAIGKVPEDIMEVIYGDHSCVVINRNGTEIDEYHHD